MRKGVGARDGENVPKAHVILVQKWPFANPKEPNGIKRKGHV